MAKNSFRWARFENDQSITKRKKQTFENDPLKKKGETKHERAFREYQQTNVVIENAEASIARLNEELIILRRSYGDHEKALADIRKQLGEAQLRLGLALIQRRKALKTLAPLKRRESKRKK